MLAQQEAHEDDTVVEREQFVAQCEQLGVELEAVQAQRRCEWDIQRCRKARSRHEPCDMCMADCEAQSFCCCCLAGPGGLMD